MQSGIPCNLEDEILCEPSHCLDSVKSSLCPKLCGKCPTQPPPGPCRQRPFCRKDDEALCVPGICSQPGVPQVINTI